MTSYTASMWRRSSRCDTSACVKVKFARSSRCESAGCVEVEFVKSSGSAGNGNCVEVGSCDCNGSEVLVRDSKDPDGPVLRFTSEEWKAFTLGVKDGEFD